MLIKLGRMVGEEEVEFIIPVMEATFTVVDENTGFINWNNDDFDVDLTDERIQNKWNEWLDFKSKSSTQIMERLDIVNFVQNLIDENLKATQNEYLREIKDIRRENDERTEKIRLENDERTEKIRKEYLGVQTALTSKMEEVTDLVSSMADGVKQDMATINKSAINMTSLKEDFAEISEMFRSILDVK